MRILTLASAVGALEYQEAINKLESTQFVKPEEPHRTLVSYFLDYLQSPKMENIQETFDWKQYSKSSSTILEIGDQIEIPPKAEAMVALEECSKTDPRCTKMMADISLHGLYGIRQNATDAFHYYKLLSDAGDAVGHRQIGNLYATGIGTERNYAKALVYMSFAALDGDLLAEQTLGYWNHAGIGMPKSCKNALWHYQRVANHINNNRLAGPPGGLKLPEPILKLDDLEGGLYGKLASGTGNPQIRNQDQGVKEADALLLHRLQADAGNPSSQYLLGYYHYVGSESVPRDFKTAYEYFLAAAKQYPTKEPNEEDARGIIEHKSAKHAAASSAGYLGQIYWRGEGVEADAETARKWFERGASQGNPTSFAFLGIMYQNGVAGLPKDLNLGLENIKKAAAKGSNFGKVLLAEHMLQSLKVDYESIFLLLTDASKKGYVPSYYYLGSLNGKNVGGRKADCESAVTYLKTFVELSNWHDPDIMDATAQYHKGNLQSAFTLFLIGAERGYQNAQVNSALMLDKNIAPSNPSLLFNTSRGWDYYSYALPLYLRAANQGHVDSRVRVGDYYFYGYVPLANFNGTVENISLSLSHEVAWYFKPNSHRVPSYEDALAHYSAAASGEFSHSSIAMYNLGYMYEFGFGVPQDYHLAKRWYDLSMSTNPSAFLPVQICLSIMNVKWAIQDLLQVFAPPPPAPQLHPPIPDGDDDDSQSSRINYFWRILEPLSFLFFCGSAIYLYSYRQRVLPQVDEIIRQARDHVSAVERQRVEMEEREPLLNDEVDLNGRDTREQGTEGH